MYKVKINASYFQENLKISKKDSCISQGKTKFLLTELQKQYLQTLLPKGYKFNLAGQIDEKRNRTPRKADAQFDTQFFKNDQKKENPAVDKKSDKKEDRKIKQKQSINNSSIQIPLNSGPVQQENMNIANVKSKGRQQKNESKAKKQIEIATNNEKVNSLIQSRNAIQQNEKDCKPQTLQQNIEKKMVSIGMSKQKQENDLEIDQKYLGKEESHLKRKNDILHGLIKEVKPFQSQFTLEQKQFCQRFISKLKVHKSSWPFRQPVDPITQGVPNYLQVVRQPMDLKTIQKKVNSNKYEHISEFHADINKIFLNSYKFNPKETNYYTLTIELENYYYELLKEIETHPHLLEPQSTSKTMKGKISMKNEQDFIEFEEENANKKSKLQQSSSKSIPEVTPIVQNKEKADIKLQKVPSIKEKTKYSEAFRKQLKSKVLKLSSEALEAIIIAVFGKIEEDRESFELDFERLSDDVINNIQNIVKSRIRNFDEIKNSNMQTTMLLF